MNIPTTNADTVRGFSNTIFARFILATKMPAISSIFILQKICFYCRMPSILDKVLSAFESLHECEKAKCGDSYAKFTSAIERHPDMQGAVFESHFKCQLQKCKKNIMHLKAKIEAELEFGILSYKAVMKESNDPTQNKIYTKNLKNKEKQLVRLRKVTYDNIRPRDVRLFL